MLMWGLFQPVMGRFIDRFGPKPVIAGSAALMGIAFLLSSTITQIWQFYVYYGILTAIGFAGCGSMANSVLVSRWYVRKRAVMLARSSMGMNVGQLLLLPLTGLLIASADFRIAFLALGLIMLVIVVPAVFFGTKKIIRRRWGKNRMEMRPRPFHPQETPSYPKPSEVVSFGLPVWRLANALGSILGTTWLMHQIFAAMGAFLMMALNEQPMQKRSDSRALP